MRVSKEWLSQYVNIDGIRVEEIAEKLTQAGVEVDTVEKRDTGIHDVVVGYVLSAEQHPNADKLKVCRVDVGEDRPVDIVCGAPCRGRAVCSRGQSRCHAPGFQNQEGKTEGRRIERDDLLCQRTRTGQ